jgi:hypothetical protein
MPRRRARHEPYEQADQIQIERWQTNWRPRRRFRPDSLGTRMTKGVRTLAMVLRGKFKPLYPRALPPSTYWYARRSSDPRYIAERIAQGRQLPPWLQYERAHPEARPKKHALNRWLAIAIELAWMLWGTKAVCGVCLRPLRTIGELWLRQPKSPRASAMGLDLCRDCALDIREYIHFLRGRAPWRDTQEPYGRGARRARRTLLLSEEGKDHG